MATQDQKTKAATQTGLYLAVIIAIAVVANMLSFKAYTRLDTTRNERYTLSKGSGRLLSSLKTPIQIDAYVPKAGLAQLDTFVRDLTDLLKEYERDGKGKFKFTLIEPNTDELREQAKEAGLQEQPFGEIDQTSSGDQATISNGYLGLVFKYGSEKAVIPQLPYQNADGLEFWITNKIREIRDKADDIKHRIGVVTGKDELKLSDANLVPKQGQGQGGPTLKGILEQAFPFYKVEDLDLKDGANAIDKDLAGIIITQPQKDYTEKELRRIDEFLLLGGKSLVVYASAVNLKPNDATMSATLNTHGLEKLLDGYGIHMNKDAVFDHGAQFRVQVMTQGGQPAWLRHPGIAHVVNDSRMDEKEKLLDTGFAGFFRLDEVIFPFPSSLELKRDKQPADVKLVAVARSTPATSVDKSDTVDMKLREQWRPKPPQDQRVLAAYADGKLKSAFAGSPMEGISPPERSPQPSRVLVVSSSLFLTNPFAYSGNGPDLGGQFAMFGAVGGDPKLLALAQPYTKYLTSTIISLKNTLDWMSGDADLVAASAKLLGEASLTYSSVTKPKFKAEENEEEMKKKDEEYRQARKDLQTKIQWFLILGMPAAFAAFGVFRWQSRQSRRNLLKA
ncbi:MAG TPA: GldG family protein [Polyangiaceae bacterium]|nr:GldG family protein [Polyangiaceae bacterium]